MAHWPRLSGLSGARLARLLKDQAPASLRLCATRVHGLFESGAGGVGGQRGGQQPASPAERPQPPSCWTPREEDVELLPLPPPPEGNEEEEEEDTPLQVALRQGFSSTAASSPAGARDRPVGGMELYYAYGPLLAGGQQEEEEEEGSASFRPPDCLLSGVEVRQANLWVGRNLTSRLHVDGLDNVLGCALGRKLVHLYSPSQTALLDPGPPTRLPVEARVTSLLYHRHRTPPTHPDFEQRAVRLVADVREGDAVFIPAGWWHEVFTLHPGPSVSVNFWCPVLHPRCRLRPSLLHIASHGKFGDFLQKRRLDEEQEQGELRVPDEGAGTNAQRRKVLKPSEGSAGGTEP